MKYAVITGYTFYFPYFPALSFHPCLFQLFIKALQYRGEGLAWFSPICDKRSHRVDSRKHSAKHNNNFCRKFSFQIFSFCFRVKTYCLLEVNVYHLPSQILIRNNFIRLRSPFLEVTFSTATKCVSGLTFPNIRTVATSREAIASLTFNVKLTVILVSYCYGTWQKSGKLYP